MRPLERNAFLKSIGVILLTAGVNFLALGQKDYQLRHFQEFQGLSSNFAQDLVQCPEGKLLVTSKQGADFFDGYKFVPLTIDSAPLEYITSVHCGHGILWMGQFDGKIHKKKGNTITTISTEINEAIQFIYTDSKNVLWAFSRSGKVYCINDKDTGMVQLPAQEMMINAISPLSEGIFMIGTNEGLYKATFAKGNKSVALDLVSQIPNSRTSALHYSKTSNILWIGTEDNGVFKLFHPNYASAHAEQFNFTDGDTIINVQSIFEDRLGRIWIGKATNGLSRITFLNKDSAAYSLHKFSDPTLVSNPISGIFEDEEGTVWVATFGGGLVQVIDNVLEQPFDEDWLKTQSITSIFKDSQANVWLGIDKGIFQTKPNSSDNSYKYYHIGGQTVTDISEGTSGNIWVGTISDGLYVKTPESSDFKHILLPDGNLSNSINSIVRNGDTQLICTKDGLYFLDSSGIVLDQLNTLDGLPHNNVKYALTDKSGNVWIAIKGNQICYFKDGKISFVEDRNSQYIGDINYIAKDNIGRMWFATLGSGIWVLDKGEAIQIAEEQGLSSSYCYQMVLDDDGNVWVSHQKSVSQITPELKVTRIIGQQDISPVSNTMITSLFKDIDGNLWITSTHGVVKYNPKVDKASKVAPKLSISAMRIFESSVEMVEGMELPFNQYNISFDLSGISLRNPGSIRYKYQLLGFSKVWSEEFSNSQIQFPRLEDGEYTLNVIASKNGGEWSKEPVSFSFIIAKPIYRTLPFFIICIVLLLGSVAGFVRYRTFKLVSDKTALEALISERTLEIQQQKEHIEESRDEISRYAKDITDSIKYAQRIQSAIFPEWNKNQSIQNDFFVFFKSKDLVTGDFFFAENVGDTFIFAAVDCTGHGVPGGFMSIVANNLLNQAVKQMGLTKPSEILNILNEGIANTLHQTYEESSVKDGMDISICSLNMKEMTLQYAGAYNPMYLFRDGQLTIYKGDRFAVGMFVGEESKAFTNTKISVQKGDVVYLFSDGFADQFGGPNGKKLKLNGFRDILNELQDKPMKIQSELLALKLDDWMGKLEQVDDIIVMGVRI
jgi:ligand-binding sensor domain-containing protein/serine phosphatase RsbU (regulator of sigma subunit)